MWNLPFRILGTPRKFNDGTGCSHVSGLSYHSCPESKVFSEHLSEHYNLPKFVERFLTNKYDSDLLRFAVSPTFFERLKRDTMKAIENYGIFPFRSRFANSGDKRDDCTYYSGLSLTYNPDNVLDRVERLRSALGEKRYSVGKVFYSGSLANDLGIDIHSRLVSKGLVPQFWRFLEGHNFEGISKTLRDIGFDELTVSKILSKLPVKGQNQYVVRGSYTDTMAYRVGTEVLSGAILDFSRSLNLSLLRSRIAMVNANYFDGEHLNRLAWHRDEDLFIGIRLNIPISTSNNFYISIADQRDYELVTGYAYTWNTSLPHRVGTRAKADEVRTHIVFAFSPWFDYCSTCDSWYPNEFFNRQHPLEVVSDRMNQLNINE